MAVRESTIVAVAVSRAKGTPKDRVDRGRLVRDRGIDGDAHAGPGPRQVSMLAWPSIRGMEARFGAPLGFGRFGENLVVDGGLDAPALGDLLAVGGRAVLEVTAIGKECHHGCVIRQQTGDCIMPREGVFARVLCGGDVQAGDRVRSMRPSTDLAVAVLAGGKSSRFGTDKRLADLGGRTLLDRALAIARAVSPEVLLSVQAGTREMVTASDSGAEPGAVPGFPVVRDEVPDAGPLAGIVAVLRASRADRVLFLPVDMPGVTPDLLKWIAAQCQGAGLSLRAGDRAHPLPACYDRSALPALEAALGTGRRSLAGAAERAGAAVRDASEAADLGDPAVLFANVNAPGDLDVLGATLAIEEDPCAT